MLLQAGCFMGQGRTEEQIRNIILTQPGIRATDIAVIVGVSKGRVSQVIKNLSERDEIDRTRETGRRGLALRPKRTWMNRRLIRMKWSAFRTGK